MKKMLSKCGNVRKIKLQSAAILKIATMLGAISEKNVHEPGAIVEKMQEKMQKIPFKKTQE